MKTLGDGTWWSGPLKTLGNALVCSMFLFCSRGPVPSSLPQLRWLWVHNDRGAGRTAAEEMFLFLFPWSLRCRRYRSYTGCVINNDRRAGLIGAEEKISLGPGSLRRRRYRSYAGCGIHNDHRAGCVGAEGMFLFLFPWSCAVVVTAATLAVGSITTTVPDACGPRRCSFVSVPVVLRRRRYRSYAGCGIHNDHRAGCIGTEEMSLFCSRGPVPSSLPQLLWLWVHNGHRTGRIGAEEMGSLGWAGSVVT